jgi:hypothetical protein
MPCVGFEPTIPASERMKTVHALDRSVTVTGNDHITRSETKDAFEEKNLQLRKLILY